MFSKWLSLLLIPLVLSTPTTSTVPAKFNNNNTITIYKTNTNNNISYTPPTHKCSKPGFFKSDHRPSWPECNRAIRALPTTHDSAPFHNNGANNGYRLPAMERFGRCRAQVELEAREAVVSSWVEVTAALDHLSTLCRRASSYGEEKTGGWMLMGPEDRIKVSLLGPDDPISGAVKE